MIGKLRELDKYHGPEYPRLDMNTWGEEGIREFLGMVDERETRYFSHTCDHCCEIDRSGTWDAEMERVQECIEVEVEKEFIQQVGEFEIGGGMARSEETTGCVAYWTNVWLAAESELDEMKFGGKRVGASAIRLLGLDPATAR